MNLCNRGRPSPIGRLQKQFCSAPGLNTDCAGEPGVPDRISKREILMAAALSRCDGHHSQLCAECTGTNGSGENLTQGRIARMVLSLGRSSFVPGQKRSSLVNHSENAGWVVNSTYFTLWAIASAIRRRSPESNICLAPVPAAFPTCLNRSGGSGGTSPTPTALRTSR